MDNDGRLKEVKTPADILQRLIRYDTSNPPGNEGECIAFINDLLTSAGFETCLAALDPKRPNLITRLKGRGNAPPLLLYGHIDVVTTLYQEWKYPPFGGEIVDGYIWGRGALDMKGGIAMMIAAMLRAREEGFEPAGDIILTILGDEESGSNYGAKYVAEHYADHFQGVRYALGEFGGFPIRVKGKKFYLIQVTEKQVCWMKATLRGPGGHGSLPFSGGTMAKLGAMLRRFDRNRLPVHSTPVARRMIETIAAELPFTTRVGLRLLLNPLFTRYILRSMGEKGRYMEAMLRNTVNATMVQGGVQINVVPSEVSISLDGRLLPGFGIEDFKKELRDIIGDEAELEEVEYHPGSDEPDMGLFDTLSGVMAELDPEGKPVPILLPAVTDARIFSGLGIQTYGYIPMNLPAGFDFVKLVHAADERIPVDALDFGAEAIYRVMRRYNAA